MSKFDRSIAGTEACFCWLQPVISAIIEMNKTVFLIFFLQLFYVVCQSLCAPARRRMPSTQYGGGSGRKGNAKTCSVYLLFCKWVLSRPFRRPAGAYRAVGGDIRVVRMAPAAALEYGTEGKNDQKKVQIDDCGAGMPCKIPYGTEFNLVNSLMERQTAERCLIT